MHCRPLQRGGSIEGACGLRFDLLRETPRCEVGSGLGSITIDRIALLESAQAIKEAEHDEGYVGAAILSETRKVRGKNASRRGRMA